MIHLISSKCVSNYTTMDSESYCLRLVTEWLNGKKISYRHCSGGGGGFSLCETGCQIKLASPYVLSIQTNPMVADVSFAETAITDGKSVVYGMWGYGDVKRFETPDDLFREIEWLLTQEIPVQK